MASFNISIKLSLVNKKEILIYGALLGLLAVPTTLSLVFFSRFSNKFYPGVHINQLDVSGLTRQQALAQLQAQTLIILPTLEVAVDNIKIASTSAELGAKPDYQAAVNQAFSLGRQGSYFHQILTVCKLLRQPTNITTPIKYDQNNLRLMVDKLKERVDIQGLQPSARLLTSGNAASLRLITGLDGRELQTEPTLEEILVSLATHNSAYLSALADLNSSYSNSPPNKTVIIQAKVASTSAKLNDEQAKAAKLRAKQLVGKKVELISDYLSLQANDQALINLLTFPIGVSDDKLKLLLSDWEKEVARSPQNAEFEYDLHTLRVSKFVPPRDGLTLDIDKTSNQLRQALANLEQPLEPTQDQAGSTDHSTSDSQTNQDNHIQTLALAAMAQPPDIPLAETNDLGINERLGFGDSYYFHSIPNRIYNVSLTTKKISYTIVKPSQEFSFNRTLGEVSQATGFRSAYVIKDGATVLGDGGGVCQVSTTLFRGLLDAGLPITKRRAHSYRVSYYEYNQKPGIDATVYAGDVDLRFVNDTGHHLLIYGEAHPNELYMFFEIYGTSDGRSTEITDHVTWDYRPPPAPVYIPDPSLPTGVTKQIDWAASGIKASFKHITRDKTGQVIKETKYYSSYQPWSAKYLQGI